MSTSTISIEVDADAARVFREASADEQRKLQLLLDMRLRELTTRRARPLEDIMDEIGRKAESLGMTPEMLKSILQDE